MLPRGRPCCCLPARPGSGYRGRLTLGDWESHDEQVTGTASLAVEQRAIHAEKLFRRAINHERAEAPRQGRPFDMAKLAAAAISLGIAILVSGQFRPETRRASGSPRPALRGADRACTPPGMGEPARALASPPSNRHREKGLPGGLPPSRSLALQARRYQPVDASEVGSSPRRFEDGGERLL